jgi:hypothetical protein
MRSNGLSAVFRTLDAELLALAPASRDRQKP